MLNFGNHHTLVLNLILAPALQLHQSHFQCSGSKSQVHSADTEHLCHCRKYWWRRWLCLRLPWEDQPRSGTGQLQTSMKELDTWEKRWLSRMDVMAHVVLPTTNSLIDLREPMSLSTSLFFRKIKVRSGPLKLSSVHILSGDLVNI